ncbi:MAG: hypothetical protein IKI03_07975 [Clostridia bacterium]|nr:hypothetical protein [Clostridia bacterium]
MKINQLINGCKWFNNVVKWNRQTSQYFFRPKAGVFVFAKTQALFHVLSVGTRDLFGDSGAVCFSVRGSGCALFYLAISK